MKLAVEAEPQFRTPEDEIAYLRAKVVERERLAPPHTHTPEGRHQIAREEFKRYADSNPALVLHETHRMTPNAAVGAAETIKASEDKVSEVIVLAESRGIRNALSVLEKLNDPYITDEVHRHLIEEIKKGKKLADFKEGAPLWSVLHMTLFEVTLPKEDQHEGREKSFKELVSAMEQFYAGMRSVSREDTAVREHFTLEVAVSDKSDDIIFYVAVPTGQSDLFEKQILSLFPNAIITEQQSDYNIFVEKGESAVSVATLHEHPIYPLRSYEHFDHDPLNVLLNSFSKIEKAGGGAALQVVFRSRGDKYLSIYRKIIGRVRDGVKPKKAITLSTFKGEMLENVKELFFSKEEKEKEVDSEALEQFNQKIDSPIFETNIRIVASAESRERAEKIIDDIESGFNQFENTKGNRLQFSRQKGSGLRRSLKSFSFREFDDDQTLPLSTRELTALIHFPQNGTNASPQFKEAKTKEAPAPNDLPTEGTLIGINDYRNRETKAYVTLEDRLRHFYIIGQTGTGKTTLMKNMIAEDMEQGHGVCFIDPHGSDIADVLAMVPESRKDDVIYFDPSYTDRVIGLNMLEFDPKYPEQKTFVVNELFSIFQKLYGAIPESMGPMFEQYFRNATLLVLEDTESGSTLLDISRVFVDAEYRALKLSKASNPVVVQFWNEIATKAGGEASLENIVPYITSKFDVFTANDYMRPIIGQQESSFNFREIMDERKILLVNLAKGRLGEINANLIGMILVGKILMAALSRSGADAKSLAPFFLHVDEFQNITTNSVAQILSEARKYRLGLTIAHQFIAQLEENIRDAVFGNVGSIAAFRVGSDDAEFLEKQFAPVFSARDLMNIENRNAFVRLLANGTPTQPFNIKTLAPREGVVGQAEVLIEASYEKYGAFRRMVEMDIAARYQP